MKVIAYIREPKEYESSFTDAVFDIEFRDDTLVSSDDEEEILRNAIVEVVPLVNGISKKNYQDLDVTDEGVLQELSESGRVDVARFVAKADNSVSNVTVLLGDTPPTEET